MHNILIKNSSNRIINNLFKTAKNVGILNYVYLLLRVSGIEYKKDDFIILERKLINWKIEEMSEESLIKNYEYIRNNLTPLQFIVNLLRCSFKESYLAFPFSCLDIGNYPNIKKATLKEILRYIISYCIKTNNNSLGIILRKIFYNTEPVINKGEIILLKRSLYFYKIFFLEFINIYKKILQGFVDYADSPKRWFKVKPFTVGELLVNADGLFGLKLYFSNGGDATYERRSDSATGYNLGCGDNGVSVFFGDIDKMKNEYIVLDVPLYQIGLPGRYNFYGEWKPFVYDGDLDLLDARLLDLLKHERGKPDFYDLYGSFQYIMATCHYVIEFIVRTNIQFPYEINHFNVGANKFEMKLVKFNEHISNSFSNMFVYDCSIILDNISIDNVRLALESINTIFSRIAFQVDSWYEVIHKYRGSNSSSGGISLHKDTDNLINYFSCFTDDDSPYFDLAIDWHIGGNKSSNLFHKFLSYCISLESIAILFIDGNLIVSQEFGIIKNKQTKLEKIACLQKVKESYGDDDLLNFIQKSYFECISPSLSIKIKSALEKVFGENSPELTEFTRKIKHKSRKEKFSLYDIRSKLAHGDFYYNDMDDIDFVQQRIHTISLLTKKFIITLLNKKNVDKNIKIKQRDKGSFHNFLTADPRTTGIANSLDMIPNKDWKIKMDWLF